MKDLIEKLEKATEGSRELDAYVWAAINGKGQPVKEVGPPAYNPSRLFCNPDPEMEWIGYDLLTLVNTKKYQYTTSLDATMTLARTNNEAGIMLNVAFHAHMKMEIDDLTSVGVNLWPAIRGTLLYVLKAREKQP